MKLLSFIFVIKLIARTNLKVMLQIIDLSSATWSLYCLRTLGIESLCKSSCLIDCVRFCGGNMVFVYMMTGL